MNRRRTVLATAITFGLAATLAACGGSRAGSAGLDGGMTGMSPTASSSSPIPSSSSMAMPADVNDQDGTFASNMISHHRQAITMADLAASRSTSPKVLALAKRIKTAQTPEIETMSGWLTSWGMTVPTDMSGMDMGGSMPGAMSEADMQKLSDMRGADFDEMFLTMMISHHKGAIKMAKTEVASGKRADAKELAQKVITDQTAEIAEIRLLLS